MIVTQLSRLALAAALILAAMATTAMIIWRHTAVVAYLWLNVLPPSFWTLTGVGLAHWRQMSAHHVTQTGMIAGRSAAKRARDDAQAARRIAADLYHAHTGLRHPHAPTEGM